MLTLLRKIQRIIELGVKDALTRVKKPLVDVSNDLVCERIMGTCIPNSNDAEILVDALCWMEKNSSANFCTNDYSDIIHNRARIYNKICMIRGYSLNQNPLKIISLDELTLISPKNKHQFSPLMMICTFLGCLRRTRCPILSSSKTLDNCSKNLDA